MIGYVGCVGFQSLEKRRLERGNTKKPGHGVEGGFTEVFEQCTEEYSGSTAIKGPAYRRSQRHSGASPGSFQITGEALVAQADHGAPGHDRPVLQLEATQFGEHLFRSLDGPIDQFEIVQLENRGSFRPGFRQRSTPLVEGAGLAVGRIDQDGAPISECLVEAAAQGTGVSDGEDQQAFRCIGSPGAAIDHCTAHVAGLCITEFGQPAMRVRADQLQRFPSLVEVGGCMCVRNIGRREPDRIEFVTDRPKSTCSRMVFKHVIDHRPGWIEHFTCFVAGSQCS